MNSKLKNILFHFFGISLYVIVFISCFLASYSMISPKMESNAVIFLLGLFLFVVYNVITVGFISITVLDSKKTILNYIMHFRKYLNIKWVYHSELGYFPIIISKRKLTVYKQGLFYLDELTDVNTDHYSVEGISNIIKSHLDWVYQTHLNDLKDSEVINKMKLKNTF